MDHAPHVQHFTVLNRLVFLFVIRLEGLLSSPCRVVLVSAVYLEKLFDEGDGQEHMQSPATKR